LLLPRAGKFFPGQAIALDFFSRSFLRWKKFQTGAPDFFIAILKKY
jgi:hypothetical protein